MKNRNSYRIRIAVILICSLILQAGIPVNAAQVKVSGAKDAVSSNINITVDTSSSDSVVKPETMPVAEEKGTQDDTSAPAKADATTDETVTINISKPTETPTPTVTPIPTVTPDPTDLPSSSTLSDKEDRASGGVSKFSLKNIGTGIKEMFSAPSDDADEGDDWDISSDGAPAKPDTTWQDIFECKAISTDHVMKIIKYTGSVNNVVIEGEAVSGGIVYTSVEIENPSNLFGNEHIGDIKTITISSGVVIKSDNLDNMFSGCTSLNSVSMSGVSTNPSSPLKSTKGMFSGCSSLKDINMTGVDTSHVTDMSMMFSGCSSLTDAGFLKNVNMGEVGTMAGMFENCTGLKSFDFGTITIPKIKYVNKMFKGCTGLAEVKFGDSTKNTLEDTSEMFKDCNGLTSLDLSPIFAKSNTVMTDMLSCNNLERIKVPYGVRKENPCKLPAEYISEDDAQTYTQLPENIDNSFWIIRADKYVHVSGNRITSNGVYQSTWTILVGETLQLSSNVKPVSANCKKVKWSSEDSNLASVDNTGLVTGLAPTDSVRSSGILINATTIDKTVSGANINRYVYVKVIEDPDLVASVSINSAKMIIDAGKKTLTLEKGDEEDLSVKILPASAEQYKDFKVSDIKWSSANSNVTVTGNGKTAKVKGINVTNKPVKVTVTYTGTDKQNKKYTRSDECEVTVTNVAITSVEVTPDKFTVSVGRVLNLKDKDVATIKVEPFDKASQDVTFAIVPGEREDVIDKTKITKGEIVGVKKGKTKIRIAAKNNSGKYKDVEVEVVNIDVTDVSLDKYDLTLYFNGVKGDTHTLKATLTPSDATNPTISWNSADEKVATVDKNTGKVTPVGYGTTKITVTVTTENNKVTKSCDVTVAPAKAKSIKLNTSKETIEVGDKLQLKATINPDLAKDSPLTWTSDKPEVATVKDGVVIGVAPGTTNIRVTTIGEDPNKPVEAVCTVTVNKPTVPVTKVTIKPKPIELQVKDEKTLTVTVEPSDASDKTITWKSSNTKIATVTKDGVVKGVAKGTATITATATGGVNDTCEVTVYAIPVGVKSVVVSPAVHEMNVGESFTITATVNPTDADNKDVTWSSSNTKVATVDDKGKVTAKSKGEAVITAKTVDGGFTDSCKVTVKDSGGGSGGGGSGGGGSGGGSTGLNTYKLYINDQRNNNAPHKDMVRGSVEKLTGDRYLVITDSDGSRLKPRVNGDSSLYHTQATYMDIRITDSSGKDVTDFGKCTIRIPLPSEMDLKNGSVRVVAENGDGIDKSISSSTGTENDVQYVTFTSSHFCQYVILYTLNQSVIDYYNNYYRALANQMMLNNGIGNKTRVLDSVPRTGYGDYKDSEEEHGNK